MSAPLSSSEKAPLPLVVVGAGWYGLAAAKQWNTQHPGSPALILDAGASIGGVWATERCYPNLKSNNLLGTFEYPDFPMTTARFGVHPREHIPGTAVHAYLRAYADEFGLTSRIRLNRKVLSAEHKPEGGWVLDVADTAGEDEASGNVKVHAERLVVATGLHSQPYMPHIQGQEEYNRPLFHSKHFEQHKDTIVPGTRVTVFGGTKSAWDAVYTYSQEGVEVDWIIRPTGHGPAWMSPPFVTPLKLQLEKLVNVRALFWFSPCIWGEDGGFLGIKRFWHGTRLGRWITDGFWKTISSDVLALMGYGQHPEIAKLTPMSEAMFTGTSFSVHNYDRDFYEPIRRGLVKIHEADLLKLSEGTVHLDDEARTALPSDAFVLVTGWKHVPPMRFLPEGLDRKIGVSYVATGEDRCAPDDGLAAQADMIREADEHITALFPRLTVPMKFNPNFKPLHQTPAFSIAASDAASAASLPFKPSMLYRFMVPGTSEFLRTKDLAFAGHLSNFSNMICAHLQGLWIAAFFDGTLARDPSAAVTAAQDDDDDDDAAADKPAEAALTLDDVHWQTVLHNRFGSWRYPRDGGAHHPDFVFEAVPYVDMLCADLGLAVHRKGGWLRELCTPYGVGDYRRVNEEFAQRAGRVTSLPTAKVVAG